MAQTERAEAFFTADGDELVPAPHARSWWSADLLHGRLLGGLMARALEREHCGPELHFSRLTVDLFRGAPLGPVRVESSLVRDGRRIRVADATVIAGGGVVARASAVLLKRSEPPAGEVPTTPAWDMPEPEQLPAPVRSDGTRWKAPWDVWFADEHNEPVHHRRRGVATRAWLRDRHELVAGESLSPFVRTALAADSASPLAHAGTAGLQFINADYTLTLSRMPLSAAIGIQATGHLDEDGIAVGHCTMHDTAGPIGFCMTAAVANPNTPRN